ncbi:hypothetical protein [Synechococcus sp. CCY 9618]|uniref:hypothetical protein n=1 Tax=Synechococcus sp. CCY 9618 TaxID=2815602 RepID=UPI001C210429|nr:hypothetical protein [Synechococcus sp. CCY 9618]
MSRHRIATLQRQLLEMPQNTNLWEQLDGLLGQAEAKPPVEPDTPAPSKIHWGPLPTQRQRKDQIFPPLRQLHYDCSSLTPLISNLYSREPSGKGWIRWVGPEPRLAVRFPFQTGIGHWRFEVQIARFFDRNDGSKLKFHVNGTALPLHWAGDNIYRAEIEGHLIDKAQPGGPGMGFSIMELSIPSSYRPDGEDQRMLSFAIGQLSMQSFEFY